MTDLVVVKVACEHKKKCGHHLTYIWPDFLHACASARQQQQQHSPKKKVHYKHVFALPELLKL